MSPMRVARSVKLLAAHRRREAVLSESTNEGKKEVRVRLFVPVLKRPAVMKISPVLHSSYNRCETSVEDSLLEVNIGMTRAALDQRRREQRALLRMKTMRIQHLKKRCKEIAADVNNQFDQLSERLLQYKGDPNWLIECFAVVFNDSAATVLEYEKEVKKLYKEVAELKHAVYKKVQVKKSGPSVSSVQKTSSSIRISSRGKQCTFSSWNFLCIIILLRY